MPKRGTYHVWEGSDGVGKSTQMAIAVAESKRRGIPTLATREPGGSSIGPEVRRILLDPNSGEIHPTAEALLFLADRVQLWFGKLSVALSEGYNVHADRNWWSALAYQGAAGGVGADTIIRLHELSLPQEYLRPDLGFVFYLTEAERLARKALANPEEFGEADRMEQKQDGYFDRVEQHYKYIRDNLGARGIHAAGKPMEVASRWWPYVFPETHAT